MKTLILTSLVAITAGGAAMAQVTVEFGTSGELIVQNPTEAPNDTDQDLHVFSTAPAAERFVELPAEEEISYAIDMPADETFDDVTALERIYPIPSEPMPLMLDQSQLIEPEKLVDILPQVEEMPVVDMPPSPPTLSQPLAEPRKLEELLRTQAVSFPNITFEFGSAVLRPEAYEQLEGIAAAMKRDKPLRIEVVGHTDDVGDHQSNQVLSTQRAEAVVTALVERFGMSPSRLSFSGRGESQPIASNSIYEGRVLNRRVELFSD